MLPGGSSTGGTFAPGSLDLNHSGTALIWDYYALITATTGRLSGTTVGNNQSAIVLSGGTLESGIVL